MKQIQMMLKPLGMCLAVLMFLISGPGQSARAAMVGTGTFLEGDKCRQTRKYLTSLLARDDVRAALVARGIDPQEANARVDSLTDEKAPRVRAIHCALVADFVGSFGIHYRFENRGAAGEEEKP